MLHEIREYDKMSRDELINMCLEKDITIDKLISTLTLTEKQLLGKEEIMNLYHCQSQKALLILKHMLVLKLSVKIGKEYYCTLENHQKFVSMMSGKEVFI